MGDRPIQNRKRRRNWFQVKRRCYLCRLCSRQPFPAWGQSGRAPCRVNRLEQLRNLTSLGREKARDRALLKSLANCADSAAFVVVAQYGATDRFALVSVDHKGELLNAASIRRTTATIAEQAVIVLSMKDPTRRNISRSATRAFASGSISGEAASIRGSEVGSDFHTVKWFPTHTGTNVDPGIPNPNEFAHDRARGLIHRDGPAAVV